MNGIIAVDETTKISDEIGINEYEIYESDLDAVYHSKHVYDVENLNR